MGFSNMQSLHEELTTLLMDNGCAVTKTAIDELIRFIANRDESTVNKIIKDCEKTLQYLDRDEYFGTKIEIINANKD